MKSTWFFEKPDSSVGQIVPVKIIKTSDNKITYLVNNKYKGVLNIRSEDYLPKRNALRDLPDGSIINCEVVGRDNQEQTLELFWFTELDLDFECQN